MNKLKSSYKTISEVVNHLNRNNPKNELKNSHTIRYWETQFKQIKPLIRAGNRRYYSDKNFKIIKKIKYLLKDKGLTINGAKKILNDPKFHNLDDDVNFSVYKPYIKETDKIKNKVNKIYKIIDELKKFK